MSELTPYQILKDSVMIKSRSQQEEFVKNYAIGIKNLVRG